MPQNIEEIVLIDAHGKRLWGGPEAEFPAFVANSGSENSALEMNAGVPGRASTRSAVIKTAESLQFISRRAMPTGTSVILPRGMLFEACVDAFNSDHLGRLNANRVEYPLLFSRSTPALIDLTADYESQGRMFKLGGPDESLRLSYAADPNLFASLAGRTLKAAELPYTVFSPQPVFRRFQSGELGINRARQFTMMDLHVLCTVKHAADTYVWALESAAHGARFWFGDDYVQVTDIIAGSELDTSAYFARLARASGSLTVIRRLRAQSKYYLLKTGLMVSSGYENLMLYNLQLDYKNPERFDISADDGQPVAVVHACSITGCNRLLPLVIGRGLAGISEQAFPIELSPQQMSLVPLRQEHLATAEIYAKELRARNIRVAIDERIDTGLGSRLNALQKDWQPAYALIGDREENGTLMLAGAPVRKGIMVENFLDAASARIRRCSSTRTRGANNLPISK